MPLDSRSETGGLYVGVSAALLRKAQVAEKVEVQEAVPPAGVLGAEPLSLMPQHFPCEPT